MIKWKSLKGIGVNSGENLFKTIAGFWSSPGDFYMSSLFKMDFTVLCLIIMGNI